MTNPLLSDWTTPQQMPPFDQIEDAHFKPALEAALTQARADIAAIAGNPEPPTFDNTIRAMEAAGPTLNKVLRVFFHIAAIDSTPEREALQKDFVTALSAYNAEVTGNEALFARIAQVWEARAALGDQEARVADLTYKSFTRGGAALKGAEKDRMTEIKARLAMLGTEFTQNILADERDWVMPLAEADLEGLPEFVIATARSAAEERGLEGHVVTLSRSLIVPFLQFSPRRDLREKAYEAWTARGANGGETDNRGNAAEILALREERARLLGYESFAAYKLEPEMAKTPDAVRDLLMQVWAPARAQAEADAEVLTQMMQADGINGDLEAWDWRYYSEKRRQAEHDLDEAELKPYLQLDRMIEAAFDCANKLFGLEFRPLDVALPHPDARAWEIWRGPRLMAVFVGDYFARGGKRSGAWCGSLRSQDKLEGDTRAIITNVCNFAKPAAGQPALLSFDDARTLFHEFGHALHHILSDVTYPTISGTSVARDFVELPSQLYEHWLEVPEVLSRYATHAETGAPMPKALLDRMLGAATYDMGFQTVEYVASAIVDLAFHDGAAPADPMARQAEVLADLGLPHAIRMRHATPHFAHVFAGDGYSSGYYSYMWSEVMDADAFAAFEEAGDPFDREVASRLEAYILSTGGSVEADRLYTEFRGRLPGVEALLKGRGLDKAA
ncbi:M3 family metallopeptidase [Tropicimonas sp. S265A]|uniref:M3 family metallopeptidase n=1 Tax=Tropicimonas sp. S265A TaxID=3415134 RepID=UPI003C7C6D85